MFLCCYRTIPTDFRLFPFSLIPSELRSKARNPKSEKNEVLGSGDGLIRSVFVEYNVLIPIDIRREREKEETQSVLTSINYCYAKYLVLATRVPVVRYMIHETK